MNIKSARLILVLVIGLIISACSEDDNINQPTINSVTFTVTLENISEVYPFIHSGVFNTPVGGSAPAELTPGKAYEFEFTAAPGMKLSFATMFAESNDLFYAPSENGIELFDASGNQLTGDITSQIFLWDAGTEINQEPGVGVDQAPRQSSLNQGAPDPDNSVRIASDDFNNLPNINEVIKVTLTSTSSTGFKLTIENVSNNSTIVSSDGSSHPAPVAPGIFVVHSSPQPIFAEGQPAYGNGLEELAEDGITATLGMNINSMTGLTSPFAPGVFAIFTGSNPIYKSNQPNFGNGLEDLAEDGVPSVLASTLNTSANVHASSTFSIPLSGSSASPIFPGDSYQFTFSAEAGQKLTFATMLGQSNDIFAAPSESGIELFKNGTPIDGDITNQIFWWDAGTEVNEEPGIGLNQAPRQAGPNTGLDENGNVMLVSGVNDGYSYPAVNSTLKVTVSSK